MLLLLHSLLDASFEVAPVVQKEVSFRQGCYVKRGKKLHVFASIQEASDWIDAEKLAGKAIEKAKKASKTKPVYVVAKPIESVDIDQLSELVNLYQMPVDMPALIIDQSWEKLLNVMHMALQLQDDEDIELLLIA